MKTKAWRKEELISDILTSIKGQFFSIFFYFVSFPYPCEVWEAGCYELGAYTAPAARIVGHRDSVNHQLDKGMASPVVSDQDSELHSQWSALIGRDHDGTALLCVMP